jgi:hypothetical protein
MEFPVALGDCGVVGGRHQVCGSKAIYIPNTKHSLLSNKKRLGKKLTTGMDSPAFREFGAAEQMAMKGAYCTT